MKAKLDILRQIDICDTRNQPIENDDFTSSLFTSMADFIDQNHEHDDFVVNQINPEFKISTVRFDIACPYDEWLLDDTSLRPYLIMEELDIMFNQAKLSGIGNLQFHRADALTLSPQIGGYSMRYKINEFN